MSKVATLGCLICSNPQVELHHITTQKGMGRKNDNYSVIPLCHAHHRTGGYGIALHAGTKTWEANFGSQADLLAQVLREVGHEVR
jgi:hypothetical protein